jgi:nanoRNase/pAp phosphatase (c-di-AMP/oligoRNAs hydrolase)
MALNLNQQIIELINKSGHILITTPSADLGDGLASGLALKLFLEKMNKPTDVVASLLTKNRLDFLPAAGKVRTEIGPLKKFIISLDISKNKVSEFNYDIDKDKLKIFITPKNNLFDKQDVSFESSAYKYDLIFVIASADLESLDELYNNYADFFYSTTIINIDTNPANEYFGQVNLIDINKSSSAEVLFSFINQVNPELISVQIATNLLAGIIIKTNSFRSLHISPNCLAAASNLIKLGADHDYIMHHINKNKNLASLNLWGRVLARLKQDTHYKLAWSLISQTDFQKSGSDEKNLEGVVSELISNSPQIEITLILYETKDGNIAAQLYTSANYNALELSQPFNASGHTRRAEFSLDTTRLVEAEEKVINKIRERIKAEH